jgi:glycosyltransferase involved in cell wall biosynthesis
VLESAPVTALHCVPGLDEPANGIAVAAKLIARRAAAGAVDVRRFPRVRDLSAYDEIWVHSCWRPATLWACWRVLRAKRPLVRMTHGNLDPVRLRHHGWKKRLAGPVERFLLRRCRRIVATCAAEKAWIEAYVGKGCPAVEIVDLKPFFDVPPPPRRPAAGERLHLLYLGRSHPLKGVAFLEEAVSQLTRTRAAALELRVVSAAFGEEKERVWDWCDVLVLPTLSENFGLVVAEALQRGKRVITTDGAPAWGTDGMSTAPGVTRVPAYGGRLLYCRGFRAGTPAQRVALICEAITRCAASRA